MYRELNGAPFPLPHGRGHPLGRIATPSHVLEVLLFVLILDQHHGECECVDGWAPPRPPHAPQAVPHGLYEVLDRRAHVAESPERVFGKR